MSALRLEIDIEGPVVTASLATPAYGVDIGFLRDLDGNCILPGTLLKGVVVHMLRLMSNRVPAVLPRAKLIDWFGQGTGDARDLDGGGAANGDFAPSRGIVRFGDLRLVEEKPARLTRIAVDGDTGSVRRGMLQVSETPIGYGETGRFAGTLAVAGDNAQAPEIAVWIKKALSLVPAIGSAKSAGFGRIAAVRCEIESEAALRGQLVSDPAARAGGLVCYALEFSEPLLVASQAISGNLFKSSEEIPGGVVKGALARAIAAAGKTAALEQALDRVIIRHAKPVLLAGSASPRLQRPLAIPLSLFSVEAFDNGDLALLEVLDAADEKNSPEAESEYPAVITFPFDWKPAGEAMRSVRAQLGHTVDLKHDVRTRTAIWPGTAAAATSQLFSRIALDPRGHAWVGEIALGKAEPNALGEILDFMRCGLSGIGKTGASAAVAFFNLAARAATPLTGAEPDRRRWRIVLETDGLLHGPDAVFAHQNLGPEARLDAQYRDYFAYAINHRLRGAATVAPDDLALRFFARQRWAGGYQALRFPAKSRGSYYPHLVTVAGSVFVLDAPEPASPAISSFLARGLPLPEGVPPANREYQRSPFVPQNGYGEVSIGGYFDWRRHA
jgi:hypothetical protein